MAGIDAITSSGHELIREGQVAEGLFGRLIAIERPTELPPADQSGAKGARPHPGLILHPQKTITGGVGSACLVATALHPRIVLTMGIIKLVAESRSVDVIAGVYNLFPS
jgi:hypothetical protein